MINYNINQTTLKILSLFNGDYDTKIHTRAAARQIKVDVKAVQQQLKKLEQNNVLVSETRGRNREYRLNKNNIQTKYSLILAETYATTTYIAQKYIIKKLLEETDDERCGIAILFGSYAKKEEDENSDIDILTVSDESYEIDNTEAEKVIGKEINAKKITRNQLIQGIKDEDPLINEVITNHVTLRGIDEFTNIRWNQYAKH